MAVDNVSLIDAIANDKENACLVLLITDHLNLDNEFEHLKILQDKINAYVAFIESEQYDEIYPNADFKMAMIEIMGNELQEWEKHEDKEAEKALGQPTFWKWEHNLLKQERQYFITHLDNLQDKIE